ncbi:MAG: hypothetical protein FWH05_09680 [Oscillospiraceae bacterium]|nr:hypothetical protein [Oscillospiraceae bacterium]
METEGIKSVAPLDTLFKADKLPFKMTLATMLKAAYWAQNQCSYQNAEEIMNSIHGIFINDDTIRSIANYVGEIVFREDCRKADKAYELLLSGKLPYPQDINGTLYIETDGAALNTRHKDETGSTWRENKLGVIFSSDNIHSWIDKHNEKQHRIQKREYVSYIGTCSEFKKHLLSCALKNGYGSYKKTILISDGAIWIRNLREEIFPDALQILDYYHLCENVHTFAKYLFNMDETKYKPWADDICKALKKSQFQEVLKELLPYKNKKPGACPVNIYGYIENNLSSIDYAKYLKKGYFIGSGAVESGNKIILQRRLKQSGMRWNTKSAQSLLTLVSKEESGLWGLEVLGAVLDFLS